MHSICADCLFIIHSHIWNSPDCKSNGVSDPEGSGWVIQASSFQSSSKTGIQAFSHSVSQSYCDSALRLFWLLASVLSTFSKLCSIPL